MAFKAGSVPPRPKLAVSMKVTGVKAGPENKDSDYDTLELLTEPTRGSKKAFPTAYVRVEQFDENFDPDDYTNFTANPELAEVLAGKQRSRGETLKLVYGMHVFAAPPPIAKKGKFAGQQRDGKVTTLMGAVGGTIAGIQAMSDAINAERKAGTLGEGIEGIAKAINAFITATGPQEVIAVLKQRTDQDGSLSEQMEVDRFIGPFTPEKVKEVLDWSEKVANDPRKTVGEKLQIGFKA